MLTHGDTGVSDDNQGSLIVVQPESAAADMTLLARIKQESATEAPAMPAPCKLTQEERAALQLTECSPEKAEEAFRTFTQETLAQGGSSTPSCGNISTF